MGTQELALELQEVKDRMTEIEYEMIEVDDTEELEAELGLLEERGAELEALIDEFKEREYA